MTTVAIIQARMGSTRLPGKTLRPLAGEPMLARVVNRTRRARRIEKVVVATTESARDEPIVTFCRERGWPCFRGSEEDVLDRYHAAAVAHGADPIVRITSDCPLIDSALVDGVLAAYAEGGCDYASNSLEPRTYPRGLDTEVVARSALDAAWREDRDPRWREHVTPFIYRHPERFRLRRIANDQDLSFHRWTVDTEEDYALVSRIYDALDGEAFGWKEVLALLEQHPDWMELNRGVHQKVVP